jgi:hypothetical protein
MVDYTCNSSHSEGEGLQRWRRIVSSRPVPEKLGKLDIKNKRARSAAQVIECLPPTCLCSICSTKIINKYIRILLHKGVFD